MRDDGANSGQETSRYQDLSEGVTTVVGKTADMLILITGVIGSLERRWTSSFAVVREGRERV